MRNSRPKTRTPTQPSSKFLQQVKVNKSQLRSNLWNSGQNSKHGKVWSCNKGRISALQQLWKTTEKLACVDRLGQKTRICLSFDFSLSLSPLNFADFLLLAHKSMWISEWMDEVKQPCIYSCPGGRIAASLGRLGPVYDILTLWLKIK